MVNCPMGVHVPRGLTLFLRVVLGGLKFMPSVGGVRLLNGIAQYLFLILKSAEVTYKHEGNVRYPV